jgi:soluble lytic murein transglycosylase-like protein
VCESDGRNDDVGFICISQLDLLWLNNKMLRLLPKFALLFLPFITMLVTMSAAKADVYGYADAEGAVYLTDSPSQVDSASQTDLPTQQDYELLAVSPVEPVSITASAPVMEPAELDSKAVVGSKALLYKDEVKVAALDSGVETALLHAVIMTESNYNARAKSPKGAQGLMQLMPFTAKRFGVNNSYDPGQNIQGGARYLSYLLKLFKNDFNLAVAAYNAGENAVIQHGNKIPPYRETVNYVSKVMGIYKKLRAA